MIKIITDQAHAPKFCEWISSRFGRTSYLDPKTTRTIALVEFIEKNGKTEANILSAVALHNWSEHACEITVASNGEKRQKATREMIFEYLSYVFDVCNKSTLFATIAVTNVNCVRLAQAVGYKERGRLPDFFGPGNDALVYSMTKTEWKNGPYATKDGAINSPLAPLVAPANYKEVLH